MRIILIVVTALASAACGEAASAPPQDRAAFLDQCRRDAVAADPDAERWADVTCAETWTAVEASRPMTDAILGLFPAGGAVGRHPAAIRRALPTVQWTTGETPEAVAGGVLGDLAVSIQRDPAGRVLFGWSEVGGMIPFAPVDAFKASGATVSTIGCYAFGASESNAVYRVEAPGHAPFAMTVYRRQAPTANAWSFLNVTVDPGGDIPDLQALGRAEPEADWATDCSEG